MTASTVDAGRQALATLMRVVEPGQPSVVRHVRSVGVEQTVADIRAGVQIGDVDSDGLRHRLATASGAADLEAAHRVGARLVSPADAEWTPLLDDLQWIDRDSLGVWVRGTSGLRDVCERAVAVVGTRTATDYGVHLASTLGADLVDRGWTVVSGLAYGIDAAAHRGAVAAGGPTVGVLACGIDVVYPQGNRRLFEQVLDCGLVVTEHPPGAAPQRPRFLIRNRIIAALSAGTVVVEMAPRSGARSTATHAFSINRHVMAMPGPVTSVVSVGCHQLLRDRPDTVLVTKADEVLEQVGHMGELAEPLVTAATTRDLLGPTVARVFEGVPVSRSADAASIARTAGVSVRVAAASLAALEAVGLVGACDGRWAMTTEGRRDRKARAAGQDQLDWW
jgi:DNA processing protein